MKSIKLLALLTFVIVGYAYFFVYKKEKNEEAAKAEQSKIFQLEGDKVTSIAITWEGETVVVKNENKVWNVVIPVKDQADAVAVGQLIQSFKAEKSLSTVAEGDKLNLKIYGLDEPAYEIRVKTEKGTSQKIVIGSVAALENQRYVWIPDAKKIVLADTAITKKFGPQLEDLRDKRFFRADKSKIQKISLQHGYVNLALEKSGNTWKYVGQDWLVDQKSVEQFLEKLSSLQAARVVSEDLTKGAKNIPLKDVQSRYQLQLEDGTTWEMRVHKIQNDQALVTIADRPIVYEVIPTALQPLTVRADIFRNRTVPFEFASEAAEEIKIQTDLTRLHLKKDGDTWKLAEPVKNKELNSQLVPQLLGQLRNLRVSEFLGDTTKVKKTKGVIKVNTKFEVFEFQWGEERGNDRVVQTSKFPTPVTVNSASIAGLPLQTLLKDNLQKKEIK